jgi:hypothetical protein
MVLTRVDDNMNKIVKVVRKQDEFFELLAKVGDIGTGVRWRSRQ